VGVLTGFPQGLLEDSFRERVILLGSSLSFTSQDESPVISMISIYLRGYKADIMNSDIISKLEEFTKGLRTLLKQIYTIILYYNIVILVNSDTTTIRKCGEDLDVILI
jgi:hypothetical protein